jgi:oligopeptide/dipeptide ABC transporter ATP-binding protein
VTVRYAGASDPAVSDADLVIEERSAIGLVGESGSGKTTFGRVLVGALRRYSGSVEVRGVTWDSTKRGDPMRRTVQMIFQDPYASLNPMLTAHQCVAEVYRFWDRCSTADAGARAAEMLGQVGLSGTVIHRRPTSLSGGQCQRVGIARALACAPALLIADEPTSSLDVSVQAQILNLLLDLRERFGLALLLISHDLSVVNYMTDRAAVMYRGRIVERGSTQALLTAPLHPYTRALVDSIPGSAEVPAFARNTVNDRQGCVFASRCPRVEDDCTTEEIVCAGPDHHQVACLHPLQATVKLRG